jgi:hypothetical protein
LKLPTGLDTVLPVKPLNFAHLMLKVGDDGLYRLTNPSGRARGFKAIGFLDAHLLERLVAP